MLLPACEEIATVGVIGGGTIGASWAAYILSRGKGVLLVEPNREAAAIRAAVERIATSLEALGSVAAPDANSLHIVRQIDGEMASVGFVQECGPERLAVKQAIFAQLEEHLPEHVVIASSTSALMASDLQSGCRHPQRILVGHPFNPPHLLSLVEVVGGSQTAAEVVAWTMDFYRHIGKYPVHVKKEVVGHIANRLSAALFREALYMVDEGIATASDIDAVITHALGLRWALMGPFLTYHLAGGEGGIQYYMEHLGPTQKARWRTLGTPHLSDQLMQTVIQEVLKIAGQESTAELAQRRDEGLVRLLTLLRG
jgi:3-hydroxyacyl-CoA dehydrogenase